MRRVILHCDCNAFFASVAETVNPELKKVPMAVVGNPKSNQGVILAKNEKAKQLGIQTAESLWQAKQKCPKLVLAPTYRSLYKEYYDKINIIYEEYTDVVERFGIDESFLDVTGSLHLFGGDKVALAHTIRKRVAKEIGLTISIGVSYNRIFAKLGSDYKKPNAVTHITETNFKDLLWDKPVSYMFMVGKVTEKTLNKLFIHTIGDLANTEPQLLETYLGKSGKILHEYSNGIDRTPIESYRDSEGAQSVGNGRTFNRSLVTRQDVFTGVSALSDTVASRLRRDKIVASSLQITIKDTHFKSITRQKSLNTPTNSAKEITEVSMELIEASWKIGNPIRMLTVTGLKLIPQEDAIEQISFFDAPNKQKDAEKQKKLEETMDSLRDKFGSNTIQLGSVIDNDLGIK